MFRECLRRWDHNHAYFVVVTVTGRGLSVLKMCTSMNVVPFSIRVELLVRVSVVYWTDVSVSDLTSGIKVIRCKRESRSIVLREYLPY